MKSLLVIITLFLQSEVILANDLAKLRADNDEWVNLSPMQTDHIRENLIHIFDSSALIFDDKTLKLREETLAKLKISKTKPDISLTLQEPARIIVKDKVFKIKKLWVSIRRSDGFVSDLVFEQQNGKSFHLNMPDGRLITYFAPYALELLKLKKQKKANEMQ